MSIRFWSAMFSRLQRFLVAQMVDFCLLMSVGGALMKTSVVGSYGMNDLCLWNVFLGELFCGLVLMCHLCLACIQSVSTSPVIFYWL